MSNISTALAIAEIAKKSLFDDKIMEAAGEIIKTIDPDLTNTQLQHLLFLYSHMLSARVATTLTAYLMPESEYNAMMLDIEELEALGNNLE